MRETTPLPKAHPAPEHRDATSDAKPGACKYLSAPRNARLRLSAAALVPLALAVASCASPASAQQGLGARRVQNSALRLGATYEIPLPPRATFKPEVEAGANVVRVRDNGASGAERRVIVEGVGDGVARIDVTWEDGSVHSYRVSVGAGAPREASAPASTWGGNSALPRHERTPSTPLEEPSISDETALPRLPPASAFPAGPRLTLQPQVAPGGLAGRTIRIRRGLARFLSFQRNILSVYFSDPGVMDARALNARTVAVNGTGIGTSTLAVSVAQSPTDTVGRIEIFNIVIEPAPAEAGPRLDASGTEAAIRSAIYDPRISVSVFPNPNGSLAASLKGTVRDAAEKSAAEATAALFVPRDAVLSALIVDASAPTLSQVLNPVAPSTPVSSEGVLQSKLRQVTGNDSIELVSLPGGLAVKASVDSAADAEALLGLLPTLNTRVLPFIVVRGQGGGSVDASGAPVGGSSSGGKYYGADRPILEGEDLTLTRRLHEVTGIRTVSVVRTAQNALATYGTVRDRNEYETVRRYLVMLPMIGAGVTLSTQSSTAATGGAFPAAGQSIGGAAGAASGALGNPQFNPALQNGEANPEPPTFGATIQAQAQVLGGAAGVGGSAGAGTGAVAPTAPAAGGAGIGTGAVAPTAPGGLGGVGGVGDFGLGGIGGVGGVGFAPGFGFAGPAAGASSVTQSTIQTAPGARLGVSSNPGGWPSAINRAQQPSGAYLQDINLQMFVRILDPAAQSVRRVTVESNIVEISRTTLKNLGVEAGSASILSEQVLAGTPATGPTVTINPATGQQTIIPGTPGTPDVTTRTLNPSLTQGVATLGNGFLGLQSFRNIDPLRLRLNALYQNGNARILSRPNISSVEGADAQIVVGGERPVPSSVATGQAVGQGIVFRRFGIILTMRPTVLDDDTIVLQIRADVTELASEYGINLNGALIPGERVRSVNTTITVRPGDTFVLGGLITNDRRQQTSRVPILSSLPIIGSLFKSKRFENNESELAIFMTPRIDKITTTVNGREAVNRVPALPPLPDSATGSAAFGVLGTASTQ